MSGELQDITVSMRYEGTWMLESFRHTLNQVFGKVDLSEQEIRDLQSIVVPFYWTCLEEWDCTMTEEDYQQARMEHFEKITRLRPTFLKLFHTDEGVAEFVISDLYDDDLDKFLVAAYRLNLSQEV